MRLEDWDKNVKPSLNFIEAGAEMAARHARRLPVRPDFDSRARVELAETRKVLEGALAKIKAAEQAYDAKPVEDAA